MLGFRVLCVRVLGFRVFGFRVRLGHARRHANYSVRPSTEGGIHGMTQHTEGCTWYMRFRVRMGPTYMYAHTRADGCHVCRIRNFEHSGRCGPSLLPVLDRGLLHGSKETKPAPANVHCSTYTSFPLFTSPTDNSVSGLFFTIHVGSSTTQHHSTLHHDLSERWNLVSTSRSIAH